MDEFQAMSASAARDVLSVDDLPADVRGVVKPELRPGERLLWASRPVRPASDATSPRSIVWASAWLTLFVMIACGAGAYFLGGFGKPTEKAKELATFFVVVPGICALVTAMIVLSMISTRARHRRAVSEVTYALTSERGLVWRPAGDRGAMEISTIARRSLAGIHRIEYPDGSGDVRFLSSVSLPEDLFGFLGVAEVRAVEFLAREILVDPNPARRDLAAGLLAD